MPVRVRLLSVNHVGLSLLLWASLPCCSRTNPKATLSGNRRYEPICVFFEPRSTTTHNTGRELAVTAVEHVLQQKGIPHERCSYARMFFRTSLRVAARLREDGKLELEVSLHRGGRRVFRQGIEPSSLPSMFKAFLSALESACDLMPCHVDGNKTQRRLGLPLWPGSSVTRKEHLAALLSGLFWMVEQIGNADAGELSDYLQVFYILWQTSAYPAFRKLGLLAGTAAVRRYYKVLPLPHEKSEISVIFDAAAGLFLLRKFGSRHPALHAALRKVLDRSPARRFIRRKNPARGGSPGQILDDLVDLYFLERLCLPPAVDYAALVRQAASMPFKPLSTLGKEIFDDQTYLVTHTIYVMSDFNLYRLDPRVLARQDMYMREHLEHYLALRDVETVGEFGDCLKILGYGYNDRVVRRITSKLVAWQNKDGSWGRQDTSDRYVRYHSTWTALYGLMDFNFLGPGPSPSLSACPPKPNGVLPKAQAERLEAL